MRTAFAAFLTLCLFLGACSKQTPKEETATVVAPPSAVVDTVKPETWAVRHETELASAIRTFRVPVFSKKLPPTGTEFTWQQTVAIGLQYLKQEGEHYGSLKDYKENYVMLQRMSKLPSGTPYIVWKAENDKQEKAPLTAKERREYTYYRTSVMTAYGVLQLGNSPLRDSMSGKEYEAQKQSVSLIFKSRALRTLALASALPSIKVAFKILGKKDADDYYDILTDADGYLALWDAKVAANEEAYLQSLQTDACWSEAWQKKYYRLPEWSSNFPKGDKELCSRLFTQYAPSGERSGYRKIETFLYRRIHEGWSVEDMREVLIKLSTTISPPQPTQVID